MTLLPRNMKRINVFQFLTILIMYSNISCGQPLLITDSSEFCGKKFIPPSECETISNMIKCDNYVFTWTYEPIADLPRHQKELLAQIYKPKKINVSVLNNELVGYLSKIDKYNCLLIIGQVNEKGVIINLFLNKVIKATADLPECVGQFISIKP